MAGRRVSKPTSLVLPSVQAAGRGIVIQIQGDGEPARRALEMVQDQLHRTSESAKHEGSEIVEAMERVKGALETVGLYMGIREGIEALKEFTAGSAEFGEKMTMASTRTGVAVETLSVLHYAADLAHTDFDQLGAAAGKLGGNLATAAAGNKTLQAAFHAVGIDAKDLAGREDGVEIALKRVGAAMAATENPATRLRIAKTLLGKAGQELIPVLIDVGEKWDELSEGAEKAGVKMDALRAQRLAALDDELDKIKENVKGAGLAFTDGLAPGLVKVFGIISEGASSDQMFESWGERVAGVASRLTALMYYLGGAAEAAFSVLEGGKLTQIGARDWDDYKNMIKKGQELEDLANDPAKMRSSEPGKPLKHGGGGIDNDGLPGGKVKPEKTLNPIAEARAQLAQEQAKLELDTQKDADAAQLAEWETQHKLLLVSDQDFYKAKWDLQNADMDAEQKALDQRKKTLEDLLRHQQGDKTLHRDKDGSSAEELKTQRELVQIAEQQEQINGRRRSSESQYNAEVGAANTASELAGLRAAAELERERNQSIEAQIALIRREHEEQAKKSTLAGGTEQDAAAIRATGELAIKRLELTQVTEQNTAAENDYRRKIDDINDAVAKGDMSKRTAAQQTRQANAQLLADLQKEAAAYRELAEAIGDPALLEKVKDMDAEIGKLGRTDHRGTFGAEIREGLQGITSQLAETAAMGKQSFGEMAQSMLQDIERLALKMEEEKFLKPLFEGKDGDDDSDGGGGGGIGGFFSTLFEHHLSGGVGSDGPQVVGERGPEIWRPPTRGGSYMTNDTLKGLATSGGGGGKAPSVSFNVTNQSSQPVSAFPGQMSWDAQAKEMVQHIILTDAHEGGPISQARG